MNQKSRVSNGPNPQTYIDQAAQALKCAPLRQMLSAFMAQPEVESVLTMPVGSGAQYQRTGLCRYVVQVLRSAADTAANASEFGGAEREVLFIATFIEGSRVFLGACIDRSSSLDDVLHTLVMDPLRHLDRQDERLAGLLRMCLDWGLPEEVDDFYVPRLRNSVRRALTRITAGMNTGTGNFLPLVGAHSAANLSRY